MLEGKTTSKMLLKVCIDKTWKELYKIPGPFQDFRQK